MNRSIRNIILCSFVFFSSAFLVGDDFVEELQENLRYYYQANVPVKLHIFRNQPGYVSGDTIFFSAKLVTASGNRLIAERTVIDVQLINISGKTCSLQKALLVGGVGSGYLNIPDTISPGAYTLIAFTRRMASAPESLFFRESLIISGEKQFLRESPVAFYPEGGKLINGVTNKVVVRAQRNAIGSFKSDGKIVSEFRTNGSGLASIYFVPRQDVHYSYQIGDGAEKQFPLKVFEGLNVLATGFENEKQIKVIIQNSPESPIKDDLHFVLWQHDQIFYKAQFSFKRKSTNIIQIPKEKLSSGVYGLTLFSTNGDVQAERLFFVPSSDAQHVNIQLSRDAWSVREIAEAKILLADDVSEATVAVSVFQDDLFVQSPLRNNIKPFLELTTDGGDQGQLEETSATDVDLFMITQKWKGFQWSDVMGRRVQPAIFNSNLSLSGVAYFDGGEPVPDSTTLQFLTKQNFMAYQTATSENGKFEFPLLLDFYGDDEVFFQAFSRDDKLDNVRVSPSFSEQRLTAPQVSESNVMDSYFKFQKEKKEVSRAFPDLARTRQVRSIDWETAILDFVGKEDQLIDLREYLMFPTMRETIHEVIPDLKARSGRRGDWVRMIITDLNREARKDPICIIDGVLTENMSYFLSIKPEDVVSMKFINTSAKLAQLGLTENGILMVRTSIKENYKNVPGAESVFTAIGLNEKRKFDLIQNAVQQQRTPDIRACIFWHPNLQLRSGSPLSISFRIPDNTGRYRIVIDGITNSGQPIHAEQIFNVVFEK